MMATDPTPTLAPLPAGTSAAGVERLKEYVKALMQHRNNPAQAVGIGGIGIGLDNAARDVMAGLAGREADKREGAYYNNAQDAPVSPYSPPTAMPPPAPAITPKPTGGMPPPMPSGNPAIPPGTGGAVPAGPTLAALGGAAPDAPFPATPTPGVSADLVRNVKKFEGYTPQAQADYKQYSNGYGTKARSPNERIDPQTAESRLQDELWKATKVVDDLGVPMTKGQREALADLTYNTGSKWTGAGLGDAVKKGDWNTARELLLKYNKAGGQTLPGLVDRRQREAQWMMPGDPPLSGAAGLAAATPPPATPQSGYPDFDRAYTETYRRLVPSMGPEKAQEMASKFVEQSKSNAPQYQADPSGLIVKQTPFQPPAISGPMQGFPGTRVPMSKVPGGQIISPPPQRGPDGGYSYPPNEIVLPNIRGDQPPAAQPIAPPAAPIAPPVARPQVTAPQAAPTPTPTPTVTTSAPQAAPGGMLAATPEPDVYQKTAQLGDAIIAARHGGNVDVAQNQEAPSTGEPPKRTSGFDLSDPTEAEAYKTVNNAITEAKATPPMDIGGLGAPNEIDLLKKRDLPGLMNVDENKKAYTGYLEDKLKEQSKDYGKYQSSFRDAASQAVKLRPALKMAVKTLDSPDFQSGPGNKIVELGQGLREELGQLSKNLADDAVKRGEDPGVYKKMADWALDPNNRQATANQVYTKLISGTVLQSLRGMLGPNAGQFRQYELQLLQQSFGSPNMTPEANKIVMTMIDKLNDRNILLGKMAGEYAAKQKGLDPTFENHVNSFEEDHPPYDYRQFMNVLKMGSEKPTRTGGVMGTTPPKAFTPTVPPP